MDKYTLKELKKIASEKKIRGRSKLNKAQLYDALKDLLEQFEEMSLATVEDKVEEELIEKMEGMDIEDPTELGVNQHLEPHEVTLHKPRMHIREVYDYVVVDCPSTEEFFPILVSEGGKVKYNDCMSYFYGHHHPYEGVWVTSDFIQGPIGIKGAYNSPLNVSFDREMTEGDDEEERDNNITQTIVKPIVDPETAGYKDLLREYAEYNIEDGNYYIQNNHIEFCKKVIERAVDWNYVPDFVSEIEKYLKFRGIDFDNKIIFRDIDCDDIGGLKELVLEFPLYEEYEFTRIIRFETEGGLYIAYLKLE